MGHKFADVVKAARGRAGLSLAEAAAKLGTFKSYVSGIETGKLRPPSPRFVGKYAKLYGLPLNELLVLAWSAKAPKPVRAIVETLVLGWIERKGAGVPMMIPLTEAERKKIVEARKIVAELKR